MKQSMKRGLCVLLVMVMALGSTSALAEEKKETIYVLSDALGQPQRVIENGETENDAAAALPVSISFHYELDGQEIAPADLKGKTGHLVIRIDYESKLSGKAEVKGETVDMPIPFLAATVLPLDRETCANVEVKNGRLVDVGRLSAVVCVGLPGLGEALNEGGYGDLDFDLEIPTGAEISADVVNYACEGAYTLVTGIPKAITEGELPVNVDIAAISGKLKDAMEQLTDGAGQLKDGTGALADGAKELSSGTGELSSGARTLNIGTMVLSQGLINLSGNSAALNDGADQIIAAVLNTANDTLAASGLQLNALTLDNYTEELNQLESEMQLTAENSAASETYQMLETLRGQLDGIKAFRDGLKQYTAGVDQAANGAKTVADGINKLAAGALTLNNGAARLAKGAAELDEGMGKLKDGLDTFDQEAVRKLTAYLDGDIREILDRVKAAVNLRYTGFLDENADSTLFIIRAEGI